MIDHKIKTLLTLVDTKSFTKTAEQLKMTQPAVSTQIKALEDQYHIKIFNRDKNDLRLTKEGALLVKYAKQFNEIEKQILPELLLLNENKVTYNIGVCIGLKEHIIHFILANYSLIHQNVKFIVATYNIRDLYKKLRSHEIDLAIIDVDNNELRYKTFPLNSDRLMFAVNDNNPLSKKEVITLSDLRNQQIILPGVNSKTYQIFSLFLLNQGLKLSDLTILMLNDSIDQCKSLVKKNIGISLFMDSFTLLDGDIKTIPLHDFNITRNINIIYDREYDHDLLIKELIQIYNKIKEVKLGVLPIT